MTSQGLDYGEDCHCTIGEDRNHGDDSALRNYLSEPDAEDIWLSSGMDENYDLRSAEVPVWGPRPCRIRG